MNYLVKKFKGQYRIKADYDLTTNDFPRDEFDNIDPSFDDLYIVSQKSFIIVRHGYRDILSCFIESAKTGRKVLRSIYEQETNKILPKYTKKKIDEEFKILIQENLILDLDLLDGEVYFTFKADKLKDYASILKLSTYGKTISPFSTKNLPKSNYDIPKNDLKEYTKILHKLGNKPIDQAHAIRTLNKIFKEKVLKKKYKKWQTESKQLTMNFKQYIHYKGLWEQYIKFLQENKK